MVYWLVSRRRVTDDTERKREAVNGVGDREEEEGLETGVRNG